MERKFFTWAEETYPEAAAVPVRVQEHMRYLHLRGATPEQIAQMFKMPVDWVEAFVRSDPGETLKH